MRITTVHFDTAHFDALDATYMFSNEKPEVGPSKIVHLVHGEKDGYLDIFKDAERRKYKNILILRDHVAFRPVDGTDFRAVDDFLSANVSRKFAYLLGCLPALMVPVGKGTFKTLAVDFYACVFSQPMRSHILEKNNDYLVFQTLFRTYTYTKPLCYLTGNEPALLLKVDEGGWLYTFAKLMMYALVVLVVLIVVMLVHYKTVITFLRSSFS
jgi:hypothetical protein